MNAPLTAPSSDGLSSTLARDWSFQVDVADNREAPEWTYVLGLSKFAPKEEATTQDDGDINSGGYASETPTELKLTVDLEGMRKGLEAAGTFTPDPGQEFLRIKGRKLGGQNYVHGRYWRNDGIDEAYDATFSVKWVNGSEGKDGLYTFSVTLTARSAPLEIEKPTSAADLTTPSTPKGGLPVGG